MSEVLLWVRGTQLRGSQAVIQKEAWSFYRTSSSVRLWWEFKEPKEPKGLRAERTRGRQVTEALISRGIQTPMARGRFT